VINLICINEIEPVVLILLLFYTYAKEIGLLCVTLVNRHCIGWFTTIFALSNDNFLHNLESELFVQHLLHYNIISQAFPASRGTFNERVPLLLTEYMKELLITM
jgi:hypothetical protein